MIYSTHKHQQENSSDVVEGILYYVSSRDLKKLDRFEGVPNHYQRHELLVKRRDNHQQIKAITYIANPNMVQDNLKPEASYLFHLLQGKEFLSEAYFQQLLKIETLFTQVGFPKQQIDPCISNLLKNCKKRLLDQSQTQPIQIIDISWDILLQLDKLLLNTSRTLQNLSNPTMSCYCWMYAMTPTEQLNCNTKFLVSNLQIKSSYSGAGVIPYIILNQQPHLLFHRKKRGKKVGYLIDFGGGRAKSDHGDPIKTAAREFAEETGGIFWNLSKEQLESYKLLHNEDVEHSQHVREAADAFQRQINKPDEPIWWSYSAGYYLFVLPVPYYISTRVLDKVWSQCDRQCTFEWISIDQVLSKKTSQPFYPRILVHWNNLTKIFHELMELH